jgi:CRISPR/Cas system CSM-associated protein Csm2 small subunit
MNTDEMLKEMLSNYSNYTPYFKLQLNLCSSEIRRLYSMERKNREKQNV